jgi:hypothetical protein
MSTGSGGDCEIPFFPDDLDVRATEPWPVRGFRALAGVDRPRKSRSRDEVGGVLIMSRELTWPMFRPCSMEWKKRQRRFD